MAEFLSKVGSSLLDLSATPLADLPHLDKETLEIAVNKLIQPCGDLNSTPADDGHVRIWQNYSAAH